MSETKTEPTKPKRQYSHYSVREVKFTFQPSQPMVVLQLIKDMEFDPPQYAKQFHPVVALIGGERRHYSRSGEHHDPFTNLHESICAKGWNLNDTGSFYDALVLDPEVGDIAPMDCLERSNTIERLVFEFQQNEASIWEEMKEDLDEKRPDEKKVENQE